MYFQNYKLSKTWLDCPPKSAVSEDPLTVNKLKGPKHLWNLYGSTFFIFFHDSEEKWFQKRLLYWSLKSGVFVNTLIALFVNTLTADCNYSVPDCENLPFPIQMQLP